MDFYDSDPEGYSDSTFLADTSELRSRFLSMIPEGGSILDLGCGSGRDSLAFHNSGYHVSAVDGSEGMCEVARRNTGLEVRHLRFSELDYVREFDGVYACASLLHIPSSELPDVLSRIHRSLRSEGVFYASFKEGESEGMRGGRYYTDMTLGSIVGLMEGNGFRIVDSWISLEPGRDIRWVNSLAVKS